MKKIIRIISSIINKILLVIISFLFVFILCVLFKIPIPFISSKIVNIIYESNHEYFSNNNIDISVESLAISWDYTLNRPFVFLKGVRYKDQQYNVDLKGIGLYFSLAELFSKRKIHLYNISLYNIELDILKTKKGSYKIVLNDNYLFNKDSNILEEVEEDNTPSINIPEVENLYYNIMNIKNSNEILYDLESINFHYLNIYFSNHDKKNININTNELNVTYQDSQILLNMHSNMYFNNSSQEESILYLDVVLYESNTLESKLFFENILLSSVYDYIFDDSDFIIQDFLGNISLDIVYNSDGSDKVVADFDIFEGALQQKEYLNAPLRVNNTTAKLLYENNIITLDDVTIDFANNNILFSNKIGLSILVNQLSGDFSMNLDTKIITNNSFIISGDNQVSFNFNYLPYIENKQGYLNINLESSKFEHTFLNLLWPKTVVPNTRIWIENNISKGTVDDINLSMSFDLLEDKIAISAFNGNASASDLEISYLNGFPIAKGEKAYITYNLDEVLIEYQDATSDLITSSYGEIIFRDLQDEDLRKLHINLNLESTISDALSILDNDPLNLPTKINLDSSRYSGLLTGNIKFDYFFKSQELINQNINLQLSQVAILDVISGIDISNGNFAWSSNDHELHMNGNITALDERINSYISINWSDVNNVKQNYDIKLEEFPIEKVRKLGFIDDYIVNMLFGQINSQIYYYKDSEGSKITFSNDLTNSVLYWDVFNYKNNEGENLSITGEALLKNDTITKINNLEIKSNSFNSKMNIDFENGERLINIDNFDIENKVSLHGKIILGDNIRTFDFQGDYININPILGFIRNRNNIQNANTEEIIDREEVLLKRETVVNRGRGIDLGDKRDVEGEGNLNINTVAPDTNLSSENFESFDIYDDSLNEILGNIDVKLSFDNVFNQSYVLNNVMIDLLWQDEFIQRLDMTYENKEDISYINFYPESSFLVLKIHNFGYLLNSLSLATNVIGGELTAKLAISKVFIDDISKDFYISSDGEFVINNFSAGFDFASSYGKIMGSDLYFNIENLTLNSNFIGGSLKGYVDIRNNNLDLYGSLTPIWSTRNFLRNAPLIKYLFGSESIIDSLISINVRIQGETDNLQYYLFREFPE